MVFVVSTEELGRGHHVLPPRHGERIGLNRFELNSMLKNETRIRFAVECFYGGGVPFANFYSGSTVAALSKHYNTYHVL